MRLNITLGHNSSAGLFGGGGLCICAYEEERLSKVKGDSSFPKLAIEEILKHYDPVMINRIGISNWFDEQGIESKYHLPKYLKARFPNAVIDDYNETHHDHHAKSVWSFSRTTNGLTIVADGFGNNSEVISLYRDGELIYRLSGYGNSLGLMYQYATSAAGLKENQDEYKLLGYEIDSKITPKLVDMPSHLTDLSRVKQYWHSKFKYMPIVDIAKTVQYNIEHRVLTLLTRYVKEDELIQLSGGIFYNVKLNNAILRGFNNKLCVNPVCGDQGNIFGLGEVRYDDLYLGLRDITPVLPNSESISTSFIGNMEFGPRALGNTSTLALPTMENVNKINSYNNRNTVMPMAPIVTEEFFKANFELTDKVIKSHKYMIISFDFKTMKDEWRGAAHYDPDRDVYTGRVQVIDYSHHLYDYVKDRGGIMINTSLNYHGTPILFNDNDYYQYIEKIRDIL